MGDTHCQSVAIGIAEQIEQALELPFMKLDSLTYGLADSNNILQTKTARLTSCGSRN